MTPQGRVKPILGHSDVGPPRGRQSSGFGPRLGLASKLNGEWIQLKELPLQGIDQILAGLGGLLGLEREGEENEEENGGSRW